MNKCLVCGKEFYPHDRNSKYCSSECRKKATQRRIRCICENCGKTFDKQVNQYQENQKHFCSRNCWHEFAFWSDEEINILIQNYNILSNAEISLLLNGKRSASSVKGKALAIGLGVDNKWTNNELNVLLNNYEVKPMQEVCKMLPNRSKSSIITQARNYNLISYYNRAKEYTKSDDEYIISNYKNMTNVQIANYLDRTPSAICCRLQKLNLHRENKYRYPTLSYYVRKRQRHWSEKILKENGCSCMLTNEAKNIVVHHIYSFNLLIDDTIKHLHFPIKASVDEYTKEELDLFYDTFNKIQDDKNSYVCISNKIHKLFHNIYGYGNNTPEQWSEFVYLYKNDKL